MSAPTTSHFIRIDGLRIHYWQAGQGGAPVLLLHGAGSDSAALSYRQTLPELARQQRVFAPDWPGQGQSDPAPDYTLESYIALLARLADALGLERFGLAGLSLGGGAALGYALRAPERVARLALVSSYGLGRRVPWGRLGALLTLTPGLSEQGWAWARRSRAVRRALLRQILRRPGALSEALLDEVGAELRRPDAGRATIAFQRHDVRPQGLRHDFSARLGELQMPVLLIHGAEDPAVPAAWAWRARARIPRAALQIIPRCGHWPPREAPHEFNRLLSACMAGV